MDAIAATEGLDGLYIGPADLSLALDLAPEMDSPVELHQTTVKRVFQAAKQHGKFVGMHCAGVEFAATAAAWGADFVTVVTDTALLRVEMAKRIARFHDLLSRT